jgi:adenosylmethionine-8-amino-7-oxononanoate aminotransferase
MSLSKRDKEVIWHPYTQMQSADVPVAIVRGEGAYLFDESGKKYIDAISSWWVNIHGHAHPYIAEKVSEQLRKLEHVIFAGFTHEPAVALAERLISILPPNQSKIFYSDNGSTAVEVAIKMTIQYWHNRGSRKNKIIAFDQSYHGDTFGSMSVSARGHFTQPFS